MIHLPCQGSGGYDCHFPMQTKGHATAMSDHVDQSEGATQRYQSFAAFYPFYIQEHQNAVSRRLHVVGTALVILCLMAGLLADWRWFLVAPVCGYAFAWVGHFFFEKNRPATFTYPLWSLMGDFRMFFEVVTGRRAW